MENIIYTLVDNFKSVKKLEFGIHDNVVLTKVDPNILLTREGLPSSHHCAMTFVKLNEKGKMESRNTFRLFNLDYTRKEIVEDMANEMGKLMDIAYIYESQEVVDSKFDILGVNYSSMEEIEKTLSTKKGAEEIQNLLANAFYDLIKDHIGEDSTRIRLKVVTNKNGEFPGLPFNGNFIEKMTTKETNLFLSKTEKENAVVKPKTASPTAVGKAPTVGGVSMMDL